MLKFRHLFEQRTNIRIDTHQRLAEKEGLTDFTLLVSRIYCIKIHLLNKETVFYRTQSLNLELGIQKTVPYMFIDSDSFIQTKLFDSIPCCLLLNERYKFLYNRKAKNNSAYFRRLQV